LLRATQTPCGPRVKPATAGRAARRRYLLAARARRKPMTQSDLFPDTPRRDAPPDQQWWPPTRAEALARLAAFTPRMGAAYAATRNFDHGPARRGNVSLLSPYLRRRLITEAEVARAALAAHGAHGAEKFLQEVVWRGYWKGWLEHRPAVWTDYRRGVAQDRAEAAPALRRRLAAAEAGESGLACFDAWTRELVETGYLHNHARMWWASIWIFTLRLPWRLGADFFLRHLLDGDPASNTLGWRWVAGLHTQGKNYRASAWNIEKYTGGRFAPDPAALNEDAAPLSDAAPLPAPVAPPPGARPDPRAPAALLLTAEDCRAEDGALSLEPGALRTVATLSTVAGLSDLPVARAVAAFETGALADAAARAQAAGAQAAGAQAAAALAAPALDFADPASLARWAQGAGAAQVVTPWAPVGPTRDWLEAARGPLSAAGVRLVQPRRAWDDALWPHATAGFFKVKARIPALLARLG